METSEAGRSDGTSVFRKSSSVSLGRADPCRTGDVKRLSSHGFPGHPTQNLAGEHGGNERRVAKPTRGSNLGSIRYPEPVRALGFEVTIHQVRTQVRALRFDSSNGLRSYPMPHKPA